MKSISASIVVLAGAVVVMAGVIPPRSYEGLIAVGGIVMIVGATLLYYSWRDKRD